MDRQIHRIWFRHLQRLEMQPMLGLGMPHPSRLIFQLAMPPSIYCQSPYLSFHL